MNFFATPAFTRIDPTVDYVSGATTGFTPIAGFGNPPANPPGVPGTTNAGGDGFLETGYLNIVTAGNYIFQLVADDGGVAYVDGILVDNGDGANLTTTGIAIPLSAGQHTVQIRINNNGTGTGATFNYQGPDTNNQNVLAPLGALSNPQGTTGAIQIGSNGSLGTGPVALSNGVLQATSAVTLTNQVSFSGGPLPVALAGSALPSPTRPR